MVYGNYGVVVCFVGILYANGIRGESNWDYTEDREQKAGHSERRESAAVTRCVPSWFCSALEQVFTAASHTAPRGSRTKGQNETRFAESLANSQSPFITKSVKIRLLIKDTGLRKVSFDGERCALQFHMFRFWEVLYKLFSRPVFLFRHHHISRAELKTWNRIIWDCLLALEIDLSKIWCYQLFRRVRYCKLCSQRTRFFKIVEKRPE